MASDTACAEEAAILMQSDDNGSVSKPDIDERLVTLSEQINLCKNILNDLRDLNNVLVRKSLGDLSLPPQN